MQVETNFPQTAGAARQELAGVGAVVERSIQAGRLVGAVVLAMRDGRLVHQAAYGMADREAGVPMRLDALFRLASVSKPMVSAAALALVGLGVLALDQAVADILPWFQPRLADGVVATITLRQLLSHTAGFGYGFLEAEGGGAYRAAGVSDGMDESDLSLEENLRRLAGVPLLYSPGEAWGYSLATDVLGAVIERASGLSLPAALARWVTQPLGLRDTSFEVADPARLAAAYVDAEPRPRRMSDLETAPVFPGTAGLRFAPRRAFDAKAFASGGSGMIGTAADFLAFLESLRADDGRVLPSRLAREMARDQAAGLTLAAWPGRGFGLGFTVLRDPQAAATPESVGSWRLGGAYGHAWFVDPARSLSVVALTNTAFEGMSGRFTVDLCEAVYAAL
ncbi:serine hydrolase [Chromobacterium sp. ATCC 53434]|uniref:serine hydrolase domain-containing protein n=1 Tax=Chromobacterium sp. (strain ATCC 53434 / SC 14030) TaxID=2059672 RepID=UPI000C7728A6|nr:serine hydrolase domain-containing protein [Chromobacterium sp. ATCC 53434]AUH51362.1 serine hydrolase [Chromobacterium sp. ATCC 53434]